MDEPINKNTLRYLANIQRECFKDNWESELEDWTTNWNDEIRCDLEELRNADELLSYLYKKYKKDRWNYKHLYYNFDGQYREDKEEMFEDVKEALKDYKKYKEEVKKYENGEL
jgi:hypothetical protein